MKVVQCVGWYFPESLGGSEIYVKGLSHELVRLGIDVTIMAPSSDPAATKVKRYEHEGLRVVRYPVPEERSLEQQLGQQPHSMFVSFFEALQAERAQVFHLQSLGYGCNEHHIEAARALSMRTFVTAHVPSFVCARGTMLRMGGNPCDGRVLESQCVPCDANSRGVPALLSPLVAPISEKVASSERLSQLVRGRAQTLLATPQRIRSRAHQLKMLFADVHGIVAVCDWLRAALIANGAPAAKLTLQRQGIDLRREPIRRARTPEQPLRVGYFGRADIFKGIDTLIDALGALDERVPIELHIYAVANANEERVKLAELKARASRDARVHVHAAVPPNEVASIMQELDLLAVPSLWLETGPLVVMEAIALGVPVLGSDRGGIAELVEHGATGWLEPPGHVARWAARLDRIARGEDSLDPSAAKIVLPTTAQVAESMHALYAASLKPQAR